MKVDPKALRAYLDSMHEEANARDLRSENIRKIVKSAKDGHQLDGKTLRKIFVRERMEPDKRQREDDLLALYQEALGPKGRALQAIDAGVPVGEAAKANGVHRATLARSRHSEGDVAKQPSNATSDHDPQTGEIIEVGVLQTNKAPAPMPVAEPTTVNSVTNESCGGESRPATSLEAEVNATCRGLEDEKGHGQRNAPLDSSGGPCGQARGAPEPVSSNLAARSDTQQCVPASDISGVNRRSERRDPEALGPHSGTAGVAPGPQDLITDVAALAALDAEETHWNRLRRTA